MLDFSFLILPEFLIDDRDSDCTKALGVVKAAGATGTALAGIGIGFLCAATFGAGCFAAAAAVGVATAADGLLSDSACSDAPDSDELKEIKKVNKAVKDISKSLVKMDDQIKTLGLKVEYVKYENAVREIQHLYDDIEFDNNGLIKKTEKGEGPDHVKKFLDLATGAYGATGLSLALDRIFDQITGHGLVRSMYTQSYFCKKEVRQYYNMLFLNSYQLLYTAYALKGWTIRKNLLDEERDRILLNNHLFWTVCGK